MFASGIEPAAAIFASGIVVFNSLNVFKDFYANYPVYTAIIKDTGPLIMKTIAGDLTRKLGEKSASITEFNSIGDGSKYATHSSIENYILHMEL